MGVRFVDEVGVVEMVVVGVCWFGCLCVDFGIVFLGEWVGE